MAATQRWRDVVAVAAGSHHTLALQANGRVLAAGDDAFGQCRVGQWRDVMAIAAGAGHSLGVRRDGTVLAIGNNDHGQCTVGGWRLCADSVR
ncbi:hypothetical protein ACSDQ9_01700 [Aestuariimicrobium soli]|uniref:hypothetical protein n=1 Tax=Aestuariimicrobium soli TaxID=2035834 RepID=UPI003EB935EE